MLVHIVPKFLTCPLSGPDCDLLDLVIPEFGITLLGGRDLCTRRPYPNKRYSVGCRKLGRKAIEGILFVAPDEVTEYKSVSRWITGSGAVVTHEVIYQRLDSEFDAVTDNMCLWSGWRRSDQVERASRWPESSTLGTPAESMPRMELSPHAGRKGDIEDRVSDGIVLHRTERLKLHTVEVERLFDRWSGGRIPERAHAFEVCATQSCH